MYKDSESIQIGLGLDFKRQKKRIEVGCQEKNYLSFSIA